MPDRGLEQEITPISVAIRANGFHPFVYKKMVLGPTGSARPRDGDIVRVVDRDEHPIGYALWNARSQIALRILSRAETPPATDFWVDRVDRAIDLRKNMLGLDAQTNAYRVIHAEADGLSGLIVDRYDDVLSAEIYSLGMYQRSGAILRLIADRLGTKHARVQVDERIALAEDFPGRPAATPRVPPKVTIKENGLRYRVLFEHSHKTGFFCDQRDNRRDLAKFTVDRSVLDLCCYTGGFGISALAAGKAKDVTCVDLDERAIAMARDNANANNVKPTLVHADAFGYMRQMGMNQKQYGVVVLDPPKLIPGRLDISSGKRKYFDLNVLAMGLVEQGGLLLTCSCSGLLSPEEFLYLLRAAARKAGRGVQVLAMTGAAPDHPVGLDALEGAYLKAAWLRMGDKFAPPGMAFSPESDRDGNAEGDGDAE
ncbi:class I SAM-dependent rRNA methyltransferase [Isosphaeraceae bacterium EP7]